MPMQSIIGLDHVVVLVRDLDEGSRRWASLGFTVSPLGLHSASMGTANHTIMLGEDYLELIAVVAPTERNLQSREFMAKRGEGIERAAFTGTNADDGVAELKSRGYAALGPFDFSRPVDLPDGQRTRASFRTFLWPVEERPGGLRIFACQHLTRENVWLSNLVTHANTATRIDRVEMLSNNPAAAAAHMGRLIDRQTETLQDGALRVQTGAGRGDFVFLDRTTLEKRHPGVSLAGVPDEGAITISVVVSDLARAKAAVGAKLAVATANSVKVAPVEANGVILELKRS